MYLGLQDLLLTPLYLLIIYFLAYLYRSKFVKNKELRKYFIPALTLKIIGAISLGLVYQFYYGGGDTLNYYYHIKVIYNVFTNRPDDAIRLILMDTEVKDVSLWEYTKKMYFARDPSSYFVIRVGAIFSIFTFGTYTLIAICFAVLSFVGAWYLYMSLTNLYPHLSKELAIAVFFIPSVFFWGSGLMKDSLTLTALSFAFYSFYRIFINKKDLLTHIVFLIIWLWILKTIKIYIAICFIPAAMLYGFSLFNNRIRSRLIRKIAKPVLISLGMIIAYLGISKFSEDDKRYNLDNIAQTAKVTADWISYVSKESGGAYYSLGDYDASLTGMLMKMPQAIWVTLFRPYIWEARNPIMILSACESMYFLYITFFVFYKLGFRKFTNIINKDYYVQFALIFSIVFAFAIGISTYNFGSLVRYKIPMMPFYLSSLFIMRSFIKAKNILHSL